MQRFLASLSAITLLTATPAVAQTAADTRVEQGPAGRSPIKVYRPLALENCRVVSNHRQTGKIPLTPQVAVDRSCQTELASRETSERKD